VILACWLHHHKSSSGYTSDASDTIPADQPKTKLWSRRNFGYITGEALHVSAGWNAFNAA